MLVTASATKESLKQRKSAGTHKTSCNLFLSNFSLHTAPLHPILEFLHLPNATLNPACNVCMSWVCNSQYHRTRKLVFVAVVCFVLFSNVKKNVHPFPVLVHQESLSDTESQKMYFKSTVIKELQWNLYTLSQLQQSLLKELNNN